MTLVTEQPNNLLTRRDLALPNGKFVICLRRGIHELTYYLQFNPNVRNNTVFSIHDTGDVYTDIMRDHARCIETNPTTMQTVYIIFCRIYWKKYIDIV